MTRVLFYQLDCRALLTRAVKRNEAALLRKALDDLLKKYNDLLGQPPTGQGLPSYQCLGLPLKMCIILTFLLP